MNLNQMINLNHSPIKPTARCLSFLDEQFFSLLVERNWA
jgi:hypothetical protein